MSIVQVAEHNFELEVLRSQTVVLVEFGAEWCGPCKTVEPELRALAEELDGKAKIVKVDIDKSPTLAQQLRIQSVPTFIVFDAGQPVDGRAGAMTRVQLRQMLEPFLPRAAGALKPEEVMELLRGGHITPVDTREPAAFKRAHLKGAINVPLDQIELSLEQLQSLKSMPVLYCRAGDKTKEVADKLAEQGMPVSFIEGGVLGWEASGFELERPD